MKIKILEEAGRFHFMKKIIIILVVLLFGCSKKNSESEFNSTNIKVKNVKKSDKKPEKSVKLNKKPKKVIKAKVVKKTVYKTAEIKLQKAVNPRELKKIISKNREFGFKVFKKINKNENIFISPLSISTIMSVLYSGADSKTEKVMGKLLNPGLKKDIYFNGLNNMLVENLSKKSRVKIFMGNSIWGDKKFKINSKFLDFNKKYFGSIVKTMDFSKKNRVSSEINSWVNQLTLGNIKNIINSSDIKKNISLILINSIYFQGGWKIKFNPKKTVKLYFYITKKKKVRGPFMFRLNEYKFYEKKGIQIVELPYAGDKFSMVVITGENRKKVEKSFLNRKIFFKLMKKMKKQLITVYLPKFSVKYEKNLNETLKLMGLTDIFSEKSDFKGISKSTIFVSKVIHKSFIEVNEKGTKAGAATSVMMMENGVPHPEFSADKPFYFVIKENKTNTIIFMGKIINPFGK
jgi:serine protease inhibitor